MIWSPIKKQKEYNATVFVQELAVRIERTDRDALVHDLTVSAKRSDRLLSSVDDGALSGDLTEEVLISGIKKVKKGGEGGIEYNEGITHKKRKGGVNRRKRSRGVHITSAAVSVKKPAQ